jgi:bacillithiol biosynthesis cysteine-adding enzyme BshC
MECSCVRHTEVPGTSRIFADLVYHFDRVEDLYPYPPNDINALAAAAAGFKFPADRRAALVAALTPLNQGNPSLEILGRPDTLAVVTGQQVGLFSGPAYTVYKALTAIKTARELTERGVTAVPVFWLATEDHDFAEVDHVWVFGGDHQPIKIRMETSPAASSHPVGGIALRDIPLSALRSALAGLPFAEDAFSLIERSYMPGETMGSAFARVIRELFASYDLLLIDPMDRAVREIAQPLMREAVERMPELIEALMARSRDLVARGYHAQVLVDKNTSLVFLLQDDERVALRRSNGEFMFARHGHHQKMSAGELAMCGTDLSPNALLRPVVQDYILPTAAYIGGPAELAYLAQSQVIYSKLLDRQPAAFPRAFFTLLDERSHKRMVRYRVNPTDLFGGEQALHSTIAASLIPPQLRARLEHTKSAFGIALDALHADLERFDVTLASALTTSRRKIEYQVGKIARKTATQIMARDAQALRDARSLNGLVFPEKHLQERFYSIVPFLAQFGPGLIDELYSAVRTDCPDHQFVVI